MTYEECYEKWKRTIQAGQSAIVNGKVCPRVEDLPSKSDWEAYRAQRTAEQTHADAQDRRISTEMQARKELARFELERFKALQADTARVLEPLRIEAARAERLLMGCR